MSTLGVITNPTSASGRGARSGKEALTALAAGGHRLLDLSRGSWAASYEAAMARRRELDALVVVGGDGMAHLGLQVCAERRLPLGIIASGSGDDVAVSVGLPRHDIPAAVRRIEDGLRGDTIRIDVGKVAGGSIEAPAPRYFGAVLSTGIDAAVAAYARSITFPRGPLKYKAAAVREIARFEPLGVRITADGKQWTQRCTLVAVANGPVFGGGLIVSPEASLTDGRLDVVLAEPMSRPDLLRIFPKLRYGGHVEDPRIRIVRVEEISLAHDPAGAPLPPAFADGELVGATPLTAKVVPRALTILGGK